MNSQAGFSSRDAMTHFRLLLRIILNNAIPRLCGRSTGRLKNWTLEFKIWKVETENKDFLIREPMSRAVLIEIPALPLLPAKYQRPQCQA
jgi:hypothetical protein